MSEKSVDRRFAAAERHVGFHDVAAAANLEHLAAKPRSRVGVEDTRFLERTECVGCQDLSPLVAVVTRGVTAAEDVREAVGQPVVRGVFEQGYLVANLAKDVQRTDRCCRVELGV